MTKKKKKKVVEDQFTFCKNLLITKGVEYSENEDNIDRLHSFKVAAAIQNITVKEALAGMMAKHTVSIYDMCKNSRKHSFEKWQEKITDQINYLLLLSALVTEEAEQNSYEKIQED